MDNFFTDFFSVAESVYRHDPAYIHEEKGVIQALFSDQNPFFDSGTIWTKVISNEIRLVGLSHPDFGDTAYFGFWETVSDLSLNQELFAELETWAQTRGCRRIDGPINFSTFFTYRILMGGTVNRLPFPREPYTPHYYQDILTELGYTLSQEYFSDFVPSYEFAPTVVAIPDLEGATIHPLSRSIWTSRFDDFLVTVHQIFAKKDYFSPSQLAACTRTNFEFVGRLLCPNTSFYATDHSGAIVGLYIIMPHYGELTCQGQPDWVPIHELDYLTHYPRLQKKIALIKTIGVTPAWEKSSLFFALSHHSLVACRHVFPDGAITALTSQLTRRLLPASAIQSTARYGVFSKNLEGVHS
jgi:hypothetical protein